jgi:2-aminoadipate transaminase
LVDLALLATFAQISLDPASAVPLYKQLADSVSTLIAKGSMQVGERLPPTRELAGQLGLNRTTVSAAYSLLEQSGVIEGHVGRGSFVARPPSADQPHTSALPKDWNTILPPLESAFTPAHHVEISFASSRPAQDEFPLPQFRTLSKEVIDSADAPEILQLGSPHGYAPLRRYLTNDAQAAGIARSGDDLMITNGCQQALDLIARLFGSDGARVVLEDPGYHGMLRVFSRAGAELVPVAVDESGMDVDALEQIVRRQSPRLVVVTPSFQNPTGATLTLERRRRIVSLAQRYGFVLVENDIYSELRYGGKPLPTLKELDETGDTILLRSYSKVSFPGLRVGWVIAPRAVVAHLAAAKQVSDLHSDQLSQAVLLRFAESGELASHLERTRIAGAERLDAALRALARYLPPSATFTRPEGGMSLWIELPAPLTAQDLLSRVQERGVNFLPGRYFSVRSQHERGLRISFGSLSIEEITRGIQILGQTAKEQLIANTARLSFEPAAALV